MKIGKWSDGTAIDLTNVPVELATNALTGARLTQTFSTKRDAMFQVTYAYHAARDDGFYVYRLETVEEVMPPITPQADSDFGRNEHARLPEPTAADEATRRIQEWADVLGVPEAS